MCVCIVVCMYVCMYTCIHVCTKRMRCINHFVPILCLLIASYIIFIVFPLTTSNYYYIVKSILISRRMGVSDRTTTRSIVRGYLWGTCSIFPVLRNNSLIYALQFPRLSGRCLICLMSFLTLLPYTHIYTSSPST